MMNSDILSLKYIQVNNYYFSVFLCGAEGYIEFLNVKWLEKILENQLEEGCFPLFSKKLNTSAFFKRRCSDHATGLAIATLALHINFRSYSIKNNHYS